jgi:hypothetical protein
MGRQLNAQFLSNSFENADYVGKFRHIQILNAQHGVFVDIMAKRDREAVGAHPDHPKCQIRVMAMNANE